MARLLKIVKRQFVHQTLLLRKCRKKYITVAGPLSKLWYALERPVVAAQDESELTVRELLNLVQQIVLFIGQANDSILYHRRLNSPTWVMKNSKKTQVMI